MSAILTLNQLKSVTNAFDSFVTIDESDIPEYYKDVFPKKCKCGGEIILTADDDGSGYTQLQCCNPDCWVKMAHRFAYFAKSLGFKGIGAQTALNLYEPLHSKFKYPTFLDIFRFTEMEMASYCGFSDAALISSMKQSLLTDSFHFKDAVSALGIPDLGKGSRIFDVAKGPVILLECILKKRINELCDMAGVYAPKSRFYMDVYKLDIINLFTEVMPHVLNTPQNEICVAITGSVVVDGIGLTRSEFIWKCESITDKNGTQMYKLVETKAESRLEYVIADAPSSSSKYALGKRLGKLITAQEFYDLLKYNAKGDNVDGE